MTDNAKKVSLSERLSINELADKFYADFKDEKLKGSIEEFVKLAFRTGYMKGHSVGYNKGAENAGYKNNSK